MCICMIVYTVYIYIYICTYQPVPPLSRLHQHPAVCLLAIHLPCLRPNRITVFLTSPVLRRSLYRNGFTIPAPPQVRSMQSAGCCFWVYLKIRHTRIPFFQKFPYYHDNVWAIRQVWTKPLLCVYIIYIYIYIHLFNI